MKVFNDVKKLQNGLHSQSFSDFPKHLHVCIICILFSTVFLTFHYLVQKISTLAYGLLLSFLRVMWNFST